MCSSHGSRGIQIFGLSPGSPLTPFLDLHDKMHARGAAMTLDGTAHLDSGTNVKTPTRTSFNVAFPSVVREKILANWESKYGLPAEPGR